MASRVWIEKIRPHVDCGRLSIKRAVAEKIDVSACIFADGHGLLGSSDTYNRPGTISMENWTMRVPRDYLKSSSEKSGNNLALNIPKALAASLRSKGETTRREHHQLISELKSCC